MNDRHSEYTDFLDHDSTCLVSTRKSLRLLALLRFLSFTGIILSLIFLLKIAPLAAWCTTAVLVILFFYWISTFNKKEKEKKFYERLTAIDRDELLALDEIYTQFDSGTEFTDPRHDYAYDLDLFGEGGLFQFLNRTSTPEGKKKLASFLTDPVLNVKILKKRQDALLELAGYVRWRHYFAAKGKAGTDQDLKLIKEASKQKGLSNRRRFRWTISIFPTISLSLLLLWGFSLLPWIFFMLSVFANMLILYLNRKKTDSFYQLFGDQSKILEDYIRLFRMIEEKDFTSDFLKEQKKQLYDQDERASRIIGKLQRTMSRFEYRSNILFAIAAEFIFLWDLQCIYQLDRWQRKYGHLVLSWFDVIAELDALSSLANLNHNHPEWALPTFEEREFCLEASDLAHPLINSARRIGNDFSMNGNGKIVIITGANMAGKSTFLRTIGVNLILAMNGCRVCAGRLTLKPSDLFTNMRTTDNLHNDESYFFAELLRLQQMLNLIREGKSPFIMIDEMLKGTNSTDKLNGSKALVKQLINLQANGIVATHDLKLTELAEALPGKVSNQCFDIRLTEENLIFDYKLKEGVTTAMNATYLMKKMGIIN